MYKFIDTTEVSESVLPSEALQINGEYIENIIAGYRTLNVTGREALSPELETFETGVRDGATLKNKRYPARKIIVQYQLIAKTNEEFRTAYNQLARILDVKNARLIFADEPDKFYTGTPAAIAKVAAGVNSVVGEIEFLCVDPFKYSVIEYEAQPDLDEKSVLIDYNGTYKAYPILEADFYSETDVADDGESATALTGAGDCGYIAFFTEDEKIVQIGDPDEADGDTTAEKSQTMVNQTFLSDTAWGTTAKALWVLNKGVIPATVTQEGNVHTEPTRVEQTTTATSTTGTLLTATSKASSPQVNYTVKAKATNRSANAVKVTISITSALASASSYMYGGIGLKASVYIGGAWHSVMLKETSGTWRGNSGHTKNLTVTVSGLTEAQTAITGIKFKVDRTDTYGNAGKLAETACANLAISAYATQAATDWYLKSADYGTSAGWHGPSITRTIGADAAGAVGATDFTLTYRQTMCIANVSTGVNQLGGFHCHLTTNDGKNVAGVRIVKTAAGKQASLMYFVNGVKVQQYGIDLSYSNKNFGINEKSVHTSTIEKSGNKITFKIGTHTYTHTDDAIASMVTNKVTFMFERNKQNAALTFNGLHSAKFVKHNCQTLKNVPNKFGANDVLEADCRTGTILLNGIHSPELGALGNDWEEFVLTPGLNQIGVAYSEWVSDEYAPNMKVRYREVFL